MQDQITLEKVKQAFEQWRAGKRHRRESAPEGIRAPMDFRRGLDGLAASCRLILKNDPFSGVIFAFRNRTGTSIQ